MPFHIYGMKEPDYVMQIMSMYGTMLELGETKKACCGEQSPTSTHLQVPQGGTQPLQVSRHD